MRDYFNPFGLLIEFITNYRRRSSCCLFSGDKPGQFFLLALNYGREVSQYLLHCLSSPSLVFIYKVLPVLRSSVDIALLDTITHISRLSLFFRSYFLCCLTYVRPACGASRLCVLRESYTARKYVAVQLSFYKEVYSPHSV